MLRRMLIASTLLVASVSGVRADSEIVQNIVITENGFFPMITYLKPGDRVTFQNESGGWRRIAAIRQDGEDDPQWNSGWLENGEKYWFLVTGSTVMEFAPLHDGNYDDTHGFFSFDAPPVE